MLVSGGGSGEHASPVIVKAGEGENGCELSEQPQLSSTTCAEVCVCPLVLGDILSNSAHPHHSLGSSARTSSQPLGAASHSIPCMLGEGRVVGGSRRASSQLLWPGVLGAWPCRLLCVLVCEEGQPRPGSMSAAWSCVGHCCPTWPELCQSATGRQAVYTGKSFWPSGGEKLASAPWRIGRKRRETGGG